MDANGDKNRTVGDVLHGLLFSAGFTCLLISPMGIVIALSTRHDHGWDWGWTAILAVVLAAGMLVVGCMLVFIGQIICWWRWGKMAGLFWKKDSEDGER
jgi:hypothetical protein